MSDDEDVPAITLLPGIPGQRRAAIDALAEAAYLDVLARTGSRAAAAVAARPHLADRRSAVKTFDRHIREDERFADMVRDVEASVAGRLDATIIDRALNGVVTYVKRDGVTGAVVEERRDYDNALLVKVARQVGKRVDPDAWAPEEKRISVTTGPTRVDERVDLDNVLEGMSSEAIRDMLAATKKARALGPPPPVVLDEEGRRTDPVAEALANVESSLDTGRKDN